MVEFHVLDKCPEKIGSDVLKILKNPRQANRGVPVGSKFGSKVQFKPTKQVNQHISKENGTNSSGTKKQAELTRQEASTTNPFDALNIVENDDDLGTYGGILNLAKKGANSDVVSSAHGTSSKVFGCPNTTPLSERINDLERQMLDGKFMLVDDDEKPVKKIVDPVNADSDSEVDEVFNEIAGFMASTSFKDTSCTKKNVETAILDASTSKSFDAHKTVENDDELGVNGGISETTDNVVNPNVANTSVGTNRKKEVSNIGKNKESVFADIKGASDVYEVYKETWHLRAEVKLK
ncbi:hypothetical protein Tco_1147061 [Tanacetum coccineum]